METTQTKILKILKRDGLISDDKGNSDEEAAIINELEAFEIIERRGKDSYKPTKRFYQYSDELIESQIPIKQYQFREEKTSPSAITVNGNISQFAQGNGVFLFDQINVEEIKITLKEVLNPAQLEELEEVLKKKDKNQLLKKLKSFGSDVLANIISGILTNPGIYF